MSEPIATYKTTNKHFTEGERVFVKTYSDTLEMVTAYGNIYRNSEHPDVSAWYIKFDDGSTYAVPNESLVHCTAVTEAG